MAITNNTIRPEPEEFLTHILGTKSL